MDLTRNHSHLLRLRIRSSTLASLIASCVQLLPSFLQRWARTTFPEWFLPVLVVVKRAKHSGDSDEQEFLDELFQTKAQAYDRLRPLQGVVISRCFGQVRYGGRKALLLEHLAGVSLVSPEGLTLGLEELADLLQPCYRALHGFGLQHDDPHPGNFQLVDGRLMVLDLESVSANYSEDERLFFIKIHIGDLARRYVEAQAYYRHEGLLEAAD